MCNKIMCSLEYGFKPQEEEAARLSDHFIRNHRNSMRLQWKMLFFSRNFVFPNTHLAWQRSERLSVELWSCYSLRCNWFMSSWTRLLFWMKPISEIRSVIVTDCVLWLRRRLLLGRRKCSIWADFWGVLAHLNVMGAQRHLGGNAKNCKPTAHHQNPPRYHLTSSHSLASSCLFIPFLPPFSNRTLNGSYVWVSSSRWQDELTDHGGTRC